MNEKLKKLLCKMNSLQCEVTNFTQRWVSEDALEYVRSLQKASFGNDGYKSFSGVKGKWKKLFPHTFDPSGKQTVVLHHAVEQQVTTKLWKGLISQEEMHSIKNLRGIPKDINGEVHLNEIRIIWNDFYRPFIQAGTRPSKQQLLDKATEIDNIYGAYVPDLIHPLELLIIKQ